MIKYPNDDNNNCNNRNNLIFFPYFNCDSIKDYIKAGLVSVGTRFKINNKWDVTCIDIDINNNDYYFQYDDCVAEADNWYDLPQILANLWDDTDIIPRNLKKEIDYIFIPTEKQVSGKNIFGEEEKNTYQFEYYKNNMAHRVKNYRGKTCWYWLATSCSGNSTYALYVDYAGFVGYTSVSNTTYRVPVCYKIHTDF